MSYFIHICTLVFTNEKKTEIASVTCSFVTTGVNCQLISLKNCELKLKSKNQVSLSIDLKLDFGGLGSDLSFALKL